jgi:hypothetical protein
MMSVIAQVDTNVFLLTETTKPQVKRHNRLFVICDNCFWVASAVSARYFDPVSCPMCAKQLSSLPISNGERYGYYYTGNRGVELDFYSDR